jgi:superoxide reductase
MANHILKFFVKNIDLDNMTEKKQIYRCNICGNIIEVLQIGTGELNCCNQAMKILKEKTGDIGPEKHIPIIEKTDAGVKIKVGKLPHPMKDEHCIEWVEIISDNRIYRNYLLPGDPPEVEFDVKIEDINQVRARQYCSIHGLWKSK